MELCPICFDDTPLNHFLKCKQCKSGACDRCFVQLSGYTCFDTNCPLLHATCPVCQTKAGLSSDVARAVVTKETVHVFSKRAINHLEEELNSVKYKLWLVMSALDTYAASLESDAAREQLDAYMPFTM